jgi:predicted choloylglycine hydrolase
VFHHRFKGNHYGIGLKFGKMLKKKNMDFDQIIELDDFKQKHGRKSQIILANVYPQVCDEIHGITDGLGYSYEKFASWLLCMGCCYEPKGCTTFCFNHNNTTFYGRNNDLPPFLKKTSKSILYKPEKGYAFIGNTSSMVNLEEGVNQKGLAVAMEFVVPKKIAPGINSVFLVRYLVEKCASTKEALEALQSLPTASNCQIILADKTGDMAVAECSPDKIFIRKPVSDDSFVVAANHFSSDQMRAYNASNWNIYSSDKRYQTAYNALKNIDYVNGVEHAKNILSGKHGFMCQYEKTLNFETIWSSVFDITNNKIYRAEGNPLKTQYIEDKRTNILFL